MKYSKLYTSPSQLVALLQTRGLQIKNIQSAENYIRHIGYYRFSAYLYPLLKMPKTMHLYKNDATFDKALDMYRFDRHLRLLMFNQIEKIEIAVRSAIVNIMSHETANPFWMTDANYFASKTKYQKTKTLIDAEISKSREDFIKHFYSTYSDPYPPSWMLAEILPLGVLTRIYENIKDNKARKLIAQAFGLNIPVFMSWMTIITVTRNNCCHHSRVWNRTYALRALTMKQMTTPWIAHTANQQKVYFSLCIIKHFVNIVSPKNDMTRKLQNLLTEYPNIDIAAMGFPIPKWQQEPLWRECPSSKWRWIKWFISLK